MFKMPNKKTLKNNLCSVSGCNNLTNTIKHLSGANFSIRVCPKHFTLKLESD